MDQLYTELILEHNQDKRNKAWIIWFYKFWTWHNPSCGDDLTLQLNVEDGIIKDAAYTGSGCAISQASASMMIDIIKDKSVEEALRLVEVFLGMIKKIYRWKWVRRIRRCYGIKNISNMPAR